MKTKLITLMLMAGLAVQAQLQNSDTKQSLRGLNGVYVITQIVDEHPEGLTIDHFTNLAKSALADAGIPAMAAPKKSNGDANLSVTIDIIHQPQLDIYGFTVEVAVTQDVQLARPVQASHMSAETWRRTLQGITSPDRLDIVDQALKQCVNKFVTDYQAVNPPK